MPELTIELIRENPWNVLVHPLPEKRIRLLLALARLAAFYCRESEALLTEVARAGAYTPKGWLPHDDDPDVHEPFEAFMFAADCKLEEIEKRIRTS